MKEKDKTEEERDVPFSDVHEMLNWRAGQEIPLDHMKILMSCWKAREHIAPRRRMFTCSETIRFLQYAW